MRPRLLEIVESGGFREIVLKDDEFLIGRGSDCDCILQSSEVSRHHCLIHVRKDEVTMTDLGSSNGSYVNGKRVISNIALKTGDQLQVGAAKFWVDLGEQINWKPPEAAAVDEFAQTTHITPQELARRARANELKE